MDIDRLVERLSKSFRTGYDLQISGLRASTTMEDIRYIQGYLDCMDDMEARLKAEYKSLNKETFNE